MLKVLVFTIFLVVSPAFGLVESLFQTENNCYSGCHLNYVDNLSNLNACQTGCDHKLHHENCADQCKILSIDEQIQASCVVGCSMNHREIKQSIENQPSQSIRLIRLRQHPSSNNDPIQVLNDMIKQFKENSNLIEQSNELKPVLNLIKHISLIKSPDTNLLNEDDRNKIQHIIIHQEDKINRLQEFIENIRSKWNQLISKQSKLPIWILLSICILSSAILWYMIISVCRHTPQHHNLSIHAQELIFEKEIIQPDPSIKIKLTNI